MLVFSTDGFLDKLEIHDPLRRDKVDSNVVQFSSADFPSIFRHRRQAERGLTQGHSLPKTVAARFSEDEDFSYSKLRYLPSPGSDTPGRVSEPSPVAMLILSAWSSRPL